MWRTQLAKGAAVSTLVKAPSSNGKSRSCQGRRYKQLRVQLCFRYPFAWTDGRWAGSFWALCRVQLLTQQDVCAGLQ